MNPYLLVALISSAFFGGWSVNDWRHDSKQKQAIEAREKKKATEQQRKDDTRRKILLGSYLLKKMENEANKEKILAELSEYLTEDRDKKLFGLQLSSDPVSR